MVQSVFILKGLTKPPVPVLQQRNQHGAQRRDERGWRRRDALRWTRIADEQQGWRRDRQTSGECLYLLSGPLWSRSCFIPAANLWPLTYRPVTVSGSGGNLCAALSGGQTNASAQSFNQLCYVFLWQGGTLIAVGLGVAAAAFAGIYNNYYYYHYYFVSLQCTALTWGKTSAPWIFCFHEKRCFLFLWQNKSLKTE